MMNRASCISPPQASIQCVGQHNNCHHTYKILRSDLFFSHILWTNVSWYLSSPHKKEWAHVYHLHTLPFEVKIAHFKHKGKWQFSMQLNVPFVEQFPDSWQTWHELCSPGLDGSSKGCSWLPWSFSLLSSSSRESKLSEDYLCWFSFFVFRSLKLSCLFHKAAVFMTQLLCKGYFFSIDTKLSTLDQYSVSGIRWLYRFCFSFPKWFQCPHFPLLSYYWFGFWIKMFVVLKNLRRNKKCNVFNRECLQWDSSKVH